MAHQSKVSWVRAQNLYLGNGTLHYYTTVAETEDLPPVYISYLGTLLSLTVVLSTLQVTTFLNGCFETSSHTLFASKFSEEIQSEHFTAVWRLQNKMGCYNSNGKVGQMGGETWDGANTEDINSLILQYFVS